MVFFKFNVAISLSFLTIAAIGIYTAVPCFLSMPANVSAGAATAAGLAVVSCIGNRAASSPYVVGLLNDFSHSSTPGLIFLAMCLLITGLICIFYCANSAKASFNPENLRKHHGNSYWKKHLSPALNKVSAGLRRKTDSGGMRCLLHYHSGEEGPQSWRLSPAREGKAARRYADLIDTEDATACVQAAAEFLGGIDIPVNNVGGIVGRKWLGEIDRQFWQTVLDVNMTTMLNVTRRRFRLKSATDGASIINPPRWRALRGMLVLSPIQPQKGPS